MKKVINNKRGFSSIETVIALTALAGLAHAAMQFTLTFLSSYRTLASVESKIREQLSGASSPCIEELAVGGFSEGRYSERYRGVNKEIKFMLGDICD